MTESAAEARIPMEPDRKKYVSVFNTASDDATRIDRRAVACFSSPPVGRM